MILIQRETLSVKGKESTLKWLKMPTRFTVDHFCKNAHNCMRFYFAAQVLSESAAMMIKDVYEDQPDKMDETGHFALQEG